ncbi:hypothetical protein [Microbulbifer litoralis]|uniref:hypothetical protein n=1 Tax=Microbulbifer litoralis TaxID=2933965 RepID=UPI0020288A30|nr:hypothetical protein [Microbulbifer sp. GX H0434]
MAHLIKKSPSETKAVKLTFEREIHFGPMLFNASFDGFKPSEDFGPITEDLCWSDDEHYLALVEVFYDKNYKSNISQLKVVDTQTGLVNTVYEKEGLIVPRRVSKSGNVKY